MITGVVDGIGVVVGSGVVVEVIGVVVPVVTGVVVVGSSVVVVCSSVVVSILVVVIGADVDDWTGVVVAVVVCGGVESSGFTQMKEQNLSSWPTSMYPCS